MTTDEPPVRTRVEEPHDVVAALLSSLAIALLVAAATVGCLRFIESWEGSPDLGTAAYLFWPMVAGAVTLLAQARPSR